MYIEIKDGLYLVYCDMLGVVGLFSDIVDAVLFSKAINEEAF